MKTLAGSPLSMNGITVKLTERVFLSKEQITEIEESCAEIREKLNDASFTSKRRLIEMLAVRGKLALVEKKVVDIKCLISLRPVSLALTSPLSNNQLVTITITGKIVLSSPPQSIIISIR